jgi:murein DD-endopeptidase MepM/ murein hydrolase activator NlpD
MARTKYRYNPETCRYEPFYLKGRALRNRALVFLMIATVVATGGYFYIRNYFETIDEFLLEQDNQVRKAEWAELRHRVHVADQKLAEFIQKDDYNYRVILDSHPLGASIREAGVGGSEKVNSKLLLEFPLIFAEAKRVEKLVHQAEIEIQSYDEINKILEKKTAMWSAKPAIQPLSNETLTYLHTTYGSRLHPIHGFVRDHKGLDMTADVGTPVYATGDGRVERANYSESFGNVIYLDHMYGYETRYAHLSKFNVTGGQRVKRGDLIGYVGSSGLSKGPHLHYEVLFQGQHVNPINFFQRDLNNKEYERLIEEASKSHESLD